MEMKHTYGKTEAAKLMNITRYAINQLVARGELVEASPRKLTGRSVREYIGQSDLAADKKMGTAPDRTASPNSTTPDTVRVTQEDSSTVSDQSGDDRESTTE